MEVKYSLGTKGETKPNLREWSMLHVFPVVLTFFWGRPQNAILRVHPHNPSLRAPSERNSEGAPSESKSEGALRSRFWGCTLTLWMWECSLHSNEFRGHPQNAVSKTKCRGNKCGNKLGQSCAKHRQAKGSWNWGCHHFLDGPYFWGCFNFEVVFILPSSSKAPAQTQLLSLIFHIIKLYYGP